MVRLCKDGSIRKEAGGRKFGAATVMTRMKANEINASGKSPIDVMLNNMLFWHDATTMFQERIERILTEEIGEEERKDLLALLKQFLSAREASQKCAVDLAPYVHPRLATIDFKGTMDKTVRHITDGMQLIEASSAYADTLKNGDPP